jgi:hypothetical protein
MGLMASRSFIGHLHGPYLDSELVKVNAFIFYQMSKDMLHLFEAAFWCSAGKIFQYGEVKGILLPSEPSVGVHLYQEVNLLNQ